MPRSAVVLESLESRVHLSMANDAFADRAVIPTLPARIVDTNVGTSAEAGEPAHNGILAERTVWWTWTARRLGTYRVTTAGSDFDTVLAVYRGSSLASLQPVASDDDGERAAGPSVVAIKARAGDTFQIAVGGYQGATGNIVLSLARSNPITIAGTKRDDIISVSANGDSYLVDVNGNPRNYPVATVSSLRILAGAGNDRVSVGSRVPQTSIYGGSGNDTIIGGDANDWILGDSGNDEIYGSFGNDTIGGGAGNDTIYGGSGNDRLDGAGGNDFIWGSYGNDTIVGGSGADRIFAEEDDDTIHVRDKRYRDTVDAGNGIDRVQVDKIDSLTGHEHLLA